MATIPIEEELRMTDDLSTIAGILKATYPTHQFKFAPLYNDSSDATCIAIWFRGRAWGKKWILFVYWPEMQTLGM